MELVGWSWLLGGAGTAGRGAHVCKWGDGPGVCVGRCLCCRGTGWAASGAGVTPVRPPRAHGDSQRDARRRAGGALEWTGHHGAFGALSGPRRGGPDDPQPPRCPPADPASGRRAAAEAPVSSPGAGGHVPEAGLQPQRIRPEVSVCVCVRGGRPSPHRSHRRQEVPSSQPPEARGPRPGGGIGLAVPASGGCSIARSDGDGGLLAPPPASPQGSPPLPPEHVPRLRMTHKILISGSHVCHVPAYGEGRSHALGGARRSARGHGVFVRLVP